MGRWKRTSSVSFALIFPRNTGELCVRSQLLSANRVRISERKTSRLAYRYQPAIVKASPFHSVFTLAIDLLTLILMAFQYTPTLELMDDHKEEFLDESTSRFELNIRSGSVCSISCSIVLPKGDCPILFTSFSPIDFRASVSAYRISLNVWRNPYGSHRKSLRDGQESSGLSMFLARLGVSYLRFVYTYRYWRISWLSLWSETVAYIL